MASNGLPIAGLYKPIWQYDTKVLAWDFGAHVAYGTGTAITFRLLTRLGAGVIRDRPQPPAGNGDTHAGPGFVRAPVAAKALRSPEQVRVLTSDRDDWSKPCDARVQVGDV
ncbi:hypothetical protein [Streptomyces solaniscabiei]|uniref:hypothetical protein n=1 Tax=Streptomyces solaniscabiei TaxID=2683255 RepID=UPI001CE2570F|nr:hypothetical protein [Streptomyces solaniscabiei]